MKRSRIFAIIAAFAALTLLFTLPILTATAQDPTPTTTPPDKPTLTPTAESIGVSTALPTVAVATPALAENINPLTGLPVEDPAILARRPLLVKISNFPPVVRPQYAINRADHMWEYIMEAGTTRLTAVFLSEDRRQIGSVRSARPVDVRLVPIYHGILAYSGASIGTEQLIRAQPWANRALWQNEDCPMFCRYEIEGVDMWHTLFLDAETVREAARERGFDVPVDLSGLTFSDEAPPGGTPAKSVEVDYHGTNAFWLYGPTANTYYRWTEGEPHHDAVGNVQVTYENVVIIYADHIETDILEDELGAGNYAMDVQLVGEGPAVVFRSGQRYDGRWLHASDEGMIRLVDGAGNDIPLTPGKTWFHPVPLDHTGLYVEN